MASNKVKMEENMFSAEVKEGKREHKETKQRLKLIYRKYERVDHKSYKRSMKIEK